MLSSVANVLVLAGIGFAIAGVAVVGCVLCGLAALFELWLFYEAGRT